MVYGMWACWCVLGAPGVAMVFLHATIAFCVAQFRSVVLSGLCSLLLLSTLRLQSVEEVKVGVPLLHTLHRAGEGSDPVEVKSHRTVASPWGSA